MFPFPSFSKPLLAFQSPVSLWHVQFCIHGSKYKLQLLKPPLGARHPSYGFEHDQSIYRVCIANLVGCALVTITLAVLQPLIDRIGVGWCFTMFGLLGGLCGPLMIWDIKCGAALRQKRQGIEHVH